MNISYTICDSVSYQAGARVVESVVRTDKTSIIVNDKIPSSLSRLVPPRWGGTRRSRLGSHL
jgi:hypothetical protein